MSQIFSQNSAILAHPFQVKPQTRISTLSQLCEPKDGGVLGGMKLLNSLDQLAFHMLLVGYISNNEHVRKCFSPRVLYSSNGDVSVPLTSILPIVDHLPKPG